MDKPRHPLVIRPWKIQQTQRNKWNAPLLKTETARFGPKNPKIAIDAKAGRENSKKRT